MKRFLWMLLAFSLFALPAAADPLTMLEDYSDTVSFPYDEADPSAGTFQYSFRYPRVSPDEEGGAAISAFYADLADYQESFTIPVEQEALRGQDARITVDYTVTCNNDEFFSVLIRKEKQIAGQSGSFWEAHVFSRKNPNPGSSYTLPKLLNILSAVENEDWIEQYQNKKANAIVWQLVWDMIRDNEEGIDYYPDYTEEYLAEDFNPEQEYYLDENGDPVFYINPGYAAPESAGLLLFPIPLEDILDEL